MNQDDMISLGVIVFSMGILAYLIMCTYEKIYLWNKYGKVFTKLRFMKYKVPVLSKWNLPVPFDTFEIENYLWGYFHRNFRLEDKAILKNLICVFVIEMSMPRTNRCAAGSAANLNTIFYYYKLGKLRIIEIDILELERRSLSGVFRTPELVRLILHPYFHHFSKENYGNEDLNHVGNCWKTLDKLD